MESRFQSLTVEMHELLRILELEGLFESDTIRVITVTSGYRASINRAINRATAMDTIHRRGFRGLVRRLFRRLTRQRFLPRFTPELGFQMEEMHIAARHGGLRLR